MLWDLNEGKHLYTLDGGDIISALCFSPNRYWLCAATGPSIKIWVSRCIFWSFLWNIGRWNSSEEKFKDLEKISFKHIELCYICLKWAVHCLLHEARQLGSILLASLSHLLSGDSCLALPFDTLTFLCYVEKPKQVKIVEWSFSLSSPGPAYSKRQNKPWSVFLCNLSIAYLKVRWL